MKRVIPFRPDGGSWRESTCTTNRTSILKKRAFNPQEEGGIEKGWGADCISIKVGIKRGEVLA